MSHKVKHETPPTHNVISVDRIEMQIKSEVNKCYLAGVRILNFSNIDWLSNQNCEPNLVWDWQIPPSVKYPNCASKTS